jgi:hypothetical protein
MARPPLSLEEVQALSEYQQLGPKRKRLIDTFVQVGGDRVEAYKITHPKCTVQKSIEAGATAAFSQPDVKAVLELYFSVDPAVVYERALRRAMQNKKITPSQLHALELYGAQYGVAKPVVPVPASEGTVVADRIVERDGRKLRQVVTDVGPAEEKS